MVPQMASKNQLSLHPEFDFQELFNYSPVAFYTCEPGGNISYYNEAATKLWGRTPKDSDLWCAGCRLFHPDGRAMPIEHSPMAVAFKKGKAQENKMISIGREDQTYRNLLVFAKPILDKQGVILGTHNTLVDITGRNSEDLKQATLSAIVDSSDDAIISKDLDGIITSWNSGASRIFGYSEKEIIGKPINILIPKSRSEDEEMIMNSVKKGQKVDHYETIRLDKFGNHIPISLTVSAIKDIEGKVVGASKIARDISAKLKVESKKSVLSAIVESSDDAIISKELNGTILSWNIGAERIFGYGEKEMLGKSILMLIPEARLAEEEQIIEQIQSGNKVDHFETFRRNKNGKEVPISLTISPVKDNKGNIIGASKVARDITSRIQAEEDIKKYIRNLEVLNSIGKSISENLDVKAVLQTVTDATTKLTGAAIGAFFYNNTNEQGDTFRLYSLSGMPQSAFEKLGMPRHTDVFMPTFVNNEVVRVDDITEDSRYGENLPFNGMPEGHFAVKSYLAVPVTSSSGIVIGGLLFGHPEPGMFQKEHEEIVMNIAGQAAISLDNSQLFERVKSLSEKKDEFIALASHELKTPLTTIKGYLQVLAKREKDQMAELFLNRSLDQVNKLHQLVEDLLNMSRIEAGKLEFNLELYDLRQQLLDITETFGYTYKTHKLICDFGEIPVYVTGDKQRLEQAIVNLMSNAVKYSPLAKKIFLALEVKGKKAIVKVRDEGIGLTSEQQSQIFTRYYRAENSQGISGLGLGLYLTKQIIDRHKGKITIKSEFGKGAEFSMSLALKKKKVK